MSELNQLQDHLSAEVASGISESTEIVVGIPGPGFGKSRIIASALASTADTNKTVLIACPPALSEQWSGQILDVDPTASVLYYGKSSIGSKTYRSFTELKPKPGMSYTFEYLASVPPMQWKKRRSRPTYFIATFHDVKQIADRFKEWFDVAIEDEYFPSMKMERIRSALRTTAKRLVCVEIQHRSLLGHSDYPR